MNKPESASRIAGRRDILRAGIVGFGKVGQQRAQCLDQIGGIDIARVSDINPAVKALTKTAEFSADYHDVVADASIDIVFVCTYNNVAPDVVVAALNAGKHVFCEKPPGKTVADVRRIMAAEAANPSRKLQFGFNHRYHYSVMEAKTIVESGQLGRLLWMRGVYGKSGQQDFEQIWRSDPELAGGGILLDQGIHMVDLFRHFCGDFDEVKSIVKTMFWSIKLEDNAFAILSNKAGQVALIHSSATQWKHRFSLEICLEQGYVNLEGILSSTRSYGTETLVFARRSVGEGATIGNPREETIYFDRDESWLLEVKDFIQSVRSDGPVRSGNSTDALRAIQLVYDIYDNGRG